MADTVRLLCVSPIGARDLAGVPGADRIVEVGEEIEVSVEVAGAPAGTYRALTDAEAHALSLGLLGGLRLRGGDTGPDGQERPLEVRDPGRGLLAQPEHWQPVTAPSKPTAK